VQREKKLPLGDDDTRDFGGTPQSAPRGLLRFYAMLSISQKPKSGYDLMKEIEFKTEGAWRPGPGAVYPVLQKLAKDGLISVRKKSGSGPIQVVYETTPAGLENISKVKKAMGLSSARFSMMSSLFIDLMEPDDLVRSVLNSFELYTGLVRVVVDSKKSGLSDEDKLFVLRQYTLNLERELARATASIKELEGGRPPQGATAVGAGR
jgi:DNA-binding PadR family transcriptional regulator